MKNFANKLKKFMYKSLQIDLKAGQLLGNEIGRYRVCEPVLKLKDEFVFYCFYEAINS